MPRGGDSGWDLAAPGWAREATPRLGAVAQAALDALGLPVGAALLDAACGPGTLALPAAARGLRVTATDRAAGMLALLGREASRRGLRVAAVRADGMALPFPDASFDAAASVFGVAHYADPARGLAELARVLRPGGRLALATWPAPPDPALAALRAALPDGIAPPARPAPLGSPEALAQALRGAGLRDTTVTRCSPALSFSSMEALWAWIASTSPWALQVRAALGERAWATANEQLRSRLAPASGSAPDSPSLSCWIASATRPPTG